MTLNRYGRQPRYSRLAVAITVVALLTPTAVDAGTLAATSSLASTTTAAPNNDDYAGAITANTNKATFNSNLVPVASGVISNLDGVFAVLDSAGTTEYAFTIQGAYNSDDGPPLTKGYRLQLGFGKGASFVPASAVAADLDFDFPQPSDPALPTSISLFGITPLFDLKSHNSDTITWSGHPFTGSFFHTSLFRLPLDVPDLPASVMSYYQPGDLPSDFPAGAKAFTIRGGFVPEPCSQSIALVALAVLATRRHSRRRLRLADAQAPEMTSGASSPPILPRASAMAALAAIMSTAAQLQGATFKVSSLVTGPHYELKSFVAGGKRYLQSDLIQPTMTAFLGDGSIDGPEGAPLPPAGTRTQLATHDFLLNTGLSDVESAELTFTPPLINGPGPDLVIFDEDYYDPEDIDLMINGKTVIYPDVSYEPSLLFISYYYYSRASPQEITLAELESDPFPISGTAGPGVSYIWGIAIDLDDFAVPALGSIAKVRFDAAPTLDNRLLDPFLFMGIRTATVPEPTTLILIGLASLLAASMQGKRLGPLNRTRRHAATYRASNTAPTTIH